MQRNLWTRCSNASKCAKGAYRSTTGPTKGVLWLGKLLLLMAVLLGVLQLSEAHAAQSILWSNSPDSSKPHTAEVLAHDLTVELIPDRHQLLATDRIVVKALKAGLDTVTFPLNRAMHVQQIYQRSNDARYPLSFAAEADDKEQGVQRITVRLGQPIGRDHTFVLEWAYEGLIDDPPREQRHLRFVTPSETAGHIGPEGVYLSGETHWYPELFGSLPTFRIRVVMPDGWQAVTHGKQIAQNVRDGMRVDEWEVTARTEALTLAANRFIKQQRNWNGIEVAAYLFPEDAHLAPEYIDVSIKYLEVYTKLLGSYPFPKFAVVENFFASGLGMPSFTLLGSGVIKRHYVQPYALGHEIVHSWLGNWILNGPDDGNWVEGLTTYLANYYYEELTGLPEQIRGQRRMMLLGYAVYVWPDEDYPIVSFRYKSDQKDNAIGYQKSAMLFHMLRHEIGDEAFWVGIRKLVAGYGGSYATWRDLERVFAEAGRTNLRWFFEQWAERAGAPVLRIAGAEVIPAGQDQRFHVKVRLVQEGIPYRLRLSAQLEAGDGRVERAILGLDSADQVFTIPVSGRPISLRIDPDFEIFRRLAREKLPPMLNLFVTAPSRTVVLPEPGDGTPEEQAPYRELAARLVAQNATQKPVAVKAYHEAVSQDGSMQIDGSLLILGGPTLNRAAERAVDACGQRVRFSNEGLMIEGRVYKGQDLVFLVSCRPAGYPEDIVTLFYGHTPAAVGKVARLLFFYGWQSYLVFRDGAVIARGDFLPEQDELEVRF